jgi:GAF domain-containing protein
MVAPMMLESRVIGYLAARNPHDGAFDESDLARFARAANVAALVVHSNIMMDEAMARRAELQLMLETARVLASERDLVKFFEVFHGLIRGVMDAETFFVGLGSWSGGEITIPYSVHRHRRVEIEKPLPIKGTLSGHVFREGMPIIARSPADFRAYAVAEQGAREGINSGIVMPLQNGHRTIGVVAAQSSKLNAYSVRERDLLEVLGELAAIAVETSRSLERSETATAERCAPEPVSRIPLPPIRESA